MIVLRGAPEEWPQQADTGVAIGVFDGVHRGHRQVIEDLVARCAQSGLVPTVATFDPHPLAEVAPERAPLMLTTLERRLELLGELGVDVVAVMSFGDVRDLSPEAFCDVVLSRSLGARLVMVGRDFRFGKGRSGDVEMLARCGQELGFDVVSAELVSEAGAPVSSTRIRLAVSQGRVEEAGSDLGRSFEVEGTVVPGDGRGRTIGVPTANVEVAPGSMVPGTGVYAARVSFGDEAEVPAVVNVGVRPTFGGGAVVVEVHLLDRNLDLYGQRLRVAFVQRIRAEMKFDGVEALVAQIRRDIETARDILGSV